ncbi:MAG: DUF2254 domain-containing protein [Microthrixaceae bacterium]
MRVFRFLTSLRNGLWFVPVMCVIAGVVLSIATTTIDRQADFELIPAALTGGPDAALAILSTVAASMVSLAALVLTITMVVVQLAMGQFSPRIVQRILQDKPSQFAIGIFVATFAHSMLAMREIDLDGGGQVPGLAILVAFAMVLVSIAVLVIYVHHIGQALRVASLIELVGKDTRALLEQYYPEDQSRTDRQDPNLIGAAKSGVVSHIAHGAIVRLARDANTCVTLVPALGEFVPAGATLSEVDPGGSELDHDRVSGNVVLSLERTLDQDVAYGLRLLVDMAIRALSDSALQDPTTAVQAIDRLHDCLRQLARRPFPSGDYSDENGTIRLRVPTMDWDDYVHLAFDEIRLAGAGSPQVDRRLRAALTDLISIAPANRIPVLSDQFGRLTTLTEEALDDADDIAESEQTDALGLGGPARS